ncbi:MAG TPA: hypothetical protein VD907_06675 [Verrucomicrobiae bacterium]|nr:hypothetical protein [Verrucomicrobiae bacterium]
MALALQYFMEFDPECRLDIYSEGFAGDVTELIGAGDNPVEYDSPEVDDPYECLRGGSLNVRFLATLDTPADTLYAEDEKYYYVEFKIGGVLQFKGYAIPDGVLQSFVLNEWETAFQVIDGLSMLENYEYSQEIGVTAGGNYLLKDIVCACLSPLTFPSDSVYIAADIEYLGAPDGIDNFDWIRVSNERYLQADQDTPMDCKAVLQSILEPFGLIIVQYLGHWYVFSPGGRMLQSSDPIKFYRYAVVNGLFMESIELNPNKILAPEWAEIKDFYHVNANQELSTARAVKITRMRYELGVRVNILTNPTFLLELAAEPPGWTVEADLIDFTFLDPGLVIRHVEGSGRNPVIASDPLAITAENGGLTLDMHVLGSSANQVPFYVVYGIQVGPNWYNGTTGQWEGVSHLNKTPIGSNAGRTIELKTTMPPVAGDLQIRLYEPEIINSAFDADIQLIFTKVTVSQGIDTGLRAWIYRHENEGNILEIPDAKTVFNGDSDASLLGSLYENDGVTPTQGIELGNKWIGDPVTNNPLFPSTLELLDVIAVRIGYSLRSRQYVYEGDVFGVVPYFSAITIDGIQDKFFVTGLTINYAKQISTIKLNQLHSGMIDVPTAAASVTKEPEYQNTIKPVING